MNSAVATQCVSLYEECGLSVEQIASELELEIETVKVVLGQHSRMYNTKLKTEEEVFSEDEFKSAKMALANSLYAEDENVRFRAAKFIINEKKGRHDTLNKALKSVTGINVLIINQQMQRAKQALEKSKQKVIDIETTDKAA